MCVREAHSVHIAGGVMEGKLHTGALIINSRALPENSAPAANVGNKTICAPSLSAAPDAPLYINVCMCAERKGESRALLFAIHG